MSWIYNFPILSANEENIIKKFLEGYTHIWECSKCGSGKKMDRPPTMKEVELYIRSCFKCRRKK